MGTKVMAEETLARSGWLYDSKGNKVNVADVVLSAYNPANSAIKVETVSSSSFVFQDAATAAGDGAVYDVAQSDELIVVEIFGTATTRSVTFYGINSNGDAIQIKGMNKATLDMANTTMSANPEFWSFDVAGFTGVKMVITSLSGGNLTIKGKVY